MITKDEIINDFFEYYANRFKTCEPICRIKPDFIFGMNLLFSEDENFIALFDEMFELYIEANKHECHSWNKKTGYMPKQTKWWYIDITNK